MGDSQRLFAISSYAKAKDGKFTDTRRISTSTLEVSSHVMQIDAALSGILASLRAMREICVACLEGDPTAEELAARNAELDALKDQISSLSASIAGTELKIFNVSGPDARNDLRRIDEVINKMSGEISEFEETSRESGEERVSAWMRELFGD